LFLSPIHGVAAAQEDVRSLGNRKGMITYAMKTAALFIVAKCLHYDTERPDAATDTASLLSITHSLGGTPGERFDIKTHLLPAHIRSAWDGLRDVLAEVNVSPAAVADGVCPFLQNEMPRILDSIPFQEARERAKGTWQTYAEPLLRHACNFVQQYMQPRKTPVTDRTHAAPLTEADAVYAVRQSASQAERLQFALRFITQCMNAESRDQLLADLQQANNSAPIAQSLERAFASSPATVDNESQDVDEPPVADVAVVVSSPAPPSAGILPPAEEGAPCVILDRAAARPVVSVVCLAEGRLASGSSCIKVWDLSRPTSRPLTLEPHAAVLPSAGRTVVTCLARRLGGNHLISGYACGSISLWNHNGVLLRNLVDHTSPITALTEMKDYPSGSTIRFASGDASGIISVWRGAESVHTRLEGHCGRVVGLVMSNGRLVSGSDDTCIRVWDATTREVTFARQFHEPDGTPICAIAALPDGKVITGSEHGNVRVWNEALDGSIDAAWSFDEGVRSLAVLSNGKIAACVGTRSVHALDYYTREQTVWFESSSDAVSLCALNDGGIAVGCADHLEIHTPMPHWPGVPAHAVASGIVAPPRSALRDL
jgi:hypothetical protein